MRQTTTKSKTKIHPLCQSVRALKIAAGWTLQEFALRAGVAQQTAYRFTAGLQVPRDPAVLGRLRDVALALGLRDEANAFDYAIRGHESQIPASGPMRIALTPTVRSGRSPEQVRLSMAIELAVSLLPDEAKAAERELPVSLSLVDQAFGDLHQVKTAYNEEHYRRVKARLDELVKQKFFPQAKKGDKQ
jgi:transcriptional regulator with XRE-family HTH domain